MNGNAVRTGDGILDEYGTATPSYVEAMRLDRRRPETLPRRMRLAVGGNGNVEFLLPGLRAGLSLAGIRAETVATPYDGWIGPALDGTLDGAPVDVDAWVIWLSAMGASRGGLERRPVDVAGVGMAVEAILQRGQMAIVILPEALPAEADPFSPFCAWRRSLLSDLRGALPPRAILLDVEHLQRRLGEERWAAGRYWTTAKCPCHPDAATAIGMAAARIADRVQRPRVKAVVVDLDNTLWGGVVGDDGPEGLLLDPDGDGRPFLEMQRFLSDVSATGVPLCVVSKNSPEQARRPFAERPEMILALKDFVYFNASWTNKHVGIRSIAEALNIGIDTVCFLDDSPHERDEARSFIPDLIVPELPEDPEARVGALIRSGLFLAPAVGEDDARRVARYKQDAVRREAGEAASDAGAYLRGLGMVLRAEPVGAVNIARATALLQKTNQFNLGMRRHGQAEIMALANADDAYAHCFALSDRFGDSGIIAVVLGGIEAGCFRIESWVMSCRVFGRGVEKAILSHILEWTGQRRCDTLVAGYVDGGRNGLVADFLRDAGFTAGPPDDAHGIEFRAVGLAPPDHALTILPPSLLQPAD